jgi:cytochrome c oxidase subunit 2
VRISGRALVGIVLALVMSGALALSCASTTPTMSDAAARGRDLANARGCVACHSITGAPSTGPTWKDAWGRPVRLTTGESVVFDGAYVSRSIEDPAAQVVDGFRPIMPKVTITDSQIADIAAYIQTLASPIGSAGSTGSTGSTGTTGANNPTGTSS